MAGPDGARELRIGFIPLVDCTPLVVAHERGFAAAEGLRLNLVRETSWANIRDRLVLGHFDAAHMLAPMPVSANLRIGSLHTPMSVPLVLNLGGNAITASTALWAEMKAAAGGELSGTDPRGMGEALAAVVRARSAAGRPPPTIGMVHPFSAHNYELRYWLAAAGVDPDEDVRLVVVPPPFMADAMAAGQVDAFCVGEPWNSLAVEAGVGRIITTKAALWRQGPEKVLSVRADWAEQAPETLAALLRALVKAAAWAEDAANREELAALLADPRYLGVDAGIIGRALSHRLVLERGGEPVEVADFLLFERSAATFPWQSHALWIYSQMVRWGQTAETAENQDRARRTYRPDIYRRVLGPEGVALPNASMKVEGALKAPTPVASSTGRMVLGPDGFFDGLEFDPDDVERYIAGFAIHKRNA
ncbi:CmpA/NrtA family ABC transporter substrate-binding protein [Indioceanicola profundi]|uniref:CmpA/NrtA family ABC transporter substrate-binding protein n=1 Tax=Indioceanicola profundi TaxID=2220096 RepID=UPI000E6AE018|nr:CmpA/NrtA family ABC transporter substrate-binding protein [Indioceanicola profundi]